MAQPGLSLALRCAELPLRSWTFPDGLLLPIGRRLRINSIVTIEDPITTDEAARIIGVSPVRVRQLCAAGRLPGSIPFGRSWIIPRASAIAFKRQPAGRPSLPPTI